MRLRLVGNGVADGSRGCKPSLGCGWAGSRLRVGTGRVPHGTYTDLTPISISIFVSISISVCISVCTDMSRSPDTDETPTA